MEKVAKKEMRQLLEQKKETASTVFTYQWIFTFSAENLQIIL
jgi:hypothetical protein